MDRPAERPQVIAHRGFSGRYPENTLSAVEAAIDLGVDMVEVDIRLSRDGVPVLCHNAHVDKTSSESGAVSEMLVADLKRLDVGSWKDPRFHNERMPTLHELLAATKGRTRLNLDIKDATALSAVVEAVRAAEMGDAVVLSGCTWRTVRRVRQVEPWLPVLLNVDRSVALLACMGLRRLAETLLLWQSLFSNAAAINVEHNHVTAQAVTRMMSADKPVWTWTVNRGRDALALAHMGVASITSNHPDRILAALAA